MIPALLIIVCLIGAATLWTVLLASQIRKEQQQIRATLQDLSEFLASQQTGPTKSNNHLTMLD